MLPFQTFKGTETNTKTLTEVLNGSERSGPQTKCVNSITFFSTRFFLFFFGTVCTLRYGLHSFVHREHQTATLGEEKKKNKQTPQRCPDECAQIASLNTDKKEKHKAETGGFFFTFKEGSKVGARGWEGRSRITA